MADSSVSSRIGFGGLAPGIALAACVAATATALEPVMRAVTGGRLGLPPIVLALVIGIFMHSLASRPRFAAGLVWCAKVLLRYAIALLGLRIALADIAGLGWGVALVVVVSMAATLAAGPALARILGLAPGYGALAGAANAVCGASATLATATVVPDYPQKSADIAFTVVAANAISTVVMLAYPVLAQTMGYDVRASGILLGATIHDMAQVAGAGYAVSDAAGNIAIIVKLFRVLLLLPVVLAMGWWFAAQGDGRGAATVPVPMFALVFLVLVLVNSVVPGIPAIGPVFAVLKPVLVQASSIGLLLAIAALGLQTSVSALLGIGWRHAALFCLLTTLILVLVIAGLALIA